MVWLKFSNILMKTLKMVASSKDEGLRHYMSGCTNLGLSERSNDSGTVPFHLFVQNGLNHVVCCHLVKHSFRLVVKLCIVDECKGDPL